VESFRGYGKKTRKQRLSGKSGLRKKIDPARRLGFFSEKGDSPRINEILPKTLL